MDTIYALATARGRTGVGVVRISGPEAAVAAAALAGPLPEARRAGLRRLTWKGELLDQALVLLFEAGASFTGEIVVELHLHGSPAAINAVLRALGEMPSLRPAEAGEFTRRALENGCLDLAQVEGLADLLDAETEAQRRQAMRVFNGSIGDRVQGWRSRLIRAAALLEATIDFVDEDVPVDVTPEVSALLASVSAELAREVEGLPIAERVRDGFEVAIVGRPNTGKSTLLNHLAGREAAITSEIAGTTRDVIEVRMDLAGLPVTVLDTAGLRDTDDRVESIGIGRALARARAADLRIFLTDDEDVPPEIAPDGEDIVVRGKADLSGRGISGLTGAGVQELVDRVAAILSRRAAGAALITRERHRREISRAQVGLASADRLLRTEGSVDLICHELHGAIQALNGLVGHVDVEHILDEIFSSFCIGK